VTTTGLEPDSADLDALDHSVFDADLSGSAFDLELLRRLFGWLRPHWKQALASAALVILSSTLVVLGPVVVSRVVIDGILHPAPAASGADQVLQFGMGSATRAIEGWTGLPSLAAACLLYGLLGTGWAVGAHYHRVLLAKAVLGGLRDLRRDLFVHLEGLPASFYDRVAVGRVMTRVTNDLEVLFQLLAGFGVMVGELVPFFVALIVMFSIAAPLTGFLLLALPLVVVATWWFRRATRDLYRDIRNSVSLLNQNLQENLSGIQVVQLYGREAYNQEAYEEINRENRDLENHAITLETLYNPFIQSLASAGLAVVLWVGGGNVLTGAMTLGSVVLFAQFIDMLFRPIVVVGEQYNVLYRAMASCERIFQALDWAESVPEPERPAQLPSRLAGRVCMRDLHFGYSRGEEILHGIDFEIQPGEKVAIVGPTGSGKTTLIRLLCRFYAVPRGHLFLDGFDLVDLSARDVRSRIGVVLQDFHIFSGSVRDNIALGNPDISHAKVEEAARLVHADAFIRKLPQGYDTPLVERGANLSHGQRQLLAFARVLAADPEILVLDEATASIDTQTERIIQEGLHRVTEGRTSILIAHRLQTIREADRIIVLQHGRIREVGSHEELMERGGLYRTLHELQFQDAAA
jgi:ATP-binding cassette subfamily B multidrug efflux pump